MEILVHPDKSELPRDYVWSWAELRGTPSYLERPAGAQSDTGAAHRLQQGEVLEVDSAV